MSNNLAYNEEDISADTGVLQLSAADPVPPAPGEVITMTRFQVRTETHTDDPAGDWLVTISWSDGKVTQSFNQNFQNLVAADYIDSAVQEAWHDRSADMTIRVQPLVAGGSINVRVLFAAD